MAKRNNMPMRWNKRLLPALLLCLACACTNRPKDVLDMRDMTDVLVDIHTLDGVFASTSYSRFQEEERDAYYEAILVRHHITKAQFDSSLLWYSRDPKKFEKVYTRVIDQLTAEEAAVKAGKYHELLPKASTITHGLVDGLHPLHAAGRLPVAPPAGIQRGGHVAGHGRCV